MNQRDINRFRLKKIYTLYVPGVYNDDRSQMDLRDARINMGGIRGGGRGNSVGGRWQGGNDRNRQNDYPNKRRRY